MEKKAVKMGKNKRKRAATAPQTTAKTPPSEPILRAETAVRGIFAAILLGVILALYPYTRDATGPIKYLVLAWGIAIASVVFLVLGTCQDIRWRTPRIFFPILVAFIGINLLAALVSNNVAYAMVTWRRFAVLFIVYFLGTRLYHTPKQISRLMLVACIGVVLSTLYGISQYFGLDPFPWESTAGIYRELPGTFGNPNYAAHTMILCVIMALYLATRHRMRWAIAFAALFLVHLYFTHQRGGLVGLGMAVVLLIAAIAVRRCIQLPRRAVAVTLIVTALVVPIAAGVAMVTLKAQTGIALPLQRSPLLRLHGYDGASRMILANPLLGYGPGNYEIENPFFWTLEEQEWFAKRRKMNQHVHNDVLEAGVDAGFPGAVLYLLFLVTGIGQGLMLAFTGRSQDHRKLGWAFAALFCAFLVDGALGFNLRVPVSAFLIFLLAGAFDGLYLDGVSTGTVPAKAPKILGIRLGLAMLAVVFAVYETRVFYAEKHLQLGRGLFLGKAFSKADEHFERAEELCPWQWVAPFERAKCALSIAQYLESEQRPDTAFAVRNKAAEHFARSAERNPTYVLSLLGIAETNLSLGYSKTEFNRDTRDEYLEKARIAAQRAESLCTLLPEAHEILGRMNALRAADTDAADSNEAGDAQDAAAIWREAIYHLERAIELGSDQRSNLYLMLAQAHVELDEFDAAEEDFRKAIAAKPDNESLLPAMYRFATQYNRYDFLRETLNNYLQRLRRGGSKEKELMAQAALYLGATEYRFFKDEEEAEKAFVAAAKAAPNNPETWSAFAQFSKQSNRPKAFQDAVTRACAEVLKAGKEPLPQLETVALVWKEGSDKLPEATEKLARAFQTALEAGIAPDEARKAYGWPAEVLLVEAQKSDVAKADRGLAMLNIGTMLHKMGLLSLAGTVLQASVNELPPQQAALAAKEASQVFARQNQNKEALDMLQKAVKLDPDNLETRLAYARTLAKQGRNTAAIEEYKRILELPSIGLEAREVITKEMRALQ